MFLINWGEIEGRFDSIYYAHRNNLLIVEQTQYIVKPLISVVKMQRGRFGHRPRNDPEYYNGDYPFIQTGNVVQASSGNLPIQYTQTLNELGLSTSRLCNERCLLITIAANIGFTAILDYPACFPDSLISMVATDGISIDYINIYLRLIRRYIENLAPQAAQKNINLQQLAPIPVIVPPESIQQNIVSIMNRAYEIKMKKELKAESLLNSINQYLLDELSISLPQAKESTLQDRMFYTSSSNVLGRRFDPKNYTRKYIEIFNALENSPVPKSSLREIVISDTSGNWGIDETEDGENFVTCLTIRATEFDNKYNLDLSNNRVKYRKYSLPVFERIQLNKNDLLIEKSGGSDDQPVGRVAFIDEEIAENRYLAFSNFIHKIVIDESKAIPEYVFEYLRLMHNIKATEVMQTQTSGIRNLIMKEYFSQKLLLPNKEHQKEIISTTRRIRSDSLALMQQAEEIVSKARAEVEVILLGGDI